MSTLATRIEQDVLVVYFRDVRIIDETRINEIGKELQDLTQSTEASRILLSFRNVSFMSSSMLGKLMLFQRQCKQAQIKLVLCDVCDNIMEVFQLMKFDKVFDIREDEESALNSLTIYREGRLRRREG